MKYMLRERKFGGYCLLAKGLVTQDIRLIILINIILEYNQSTLRNRRNEIRFNTKSNAYSSALNKMNRRCLYDYVFAQNECITRYYIKSSTLYNSTLIRTSKDLEITCFFAVFHRGFGAFIVGTGTTFSTTGS